jgi:alpha-beta hydrolase superfamily lysophospholipase
LFDAGYLVAMYDWRGLGASEGDFSNTTLGTHSSDFRQVVGWLHRSCGIAPADLCLVGFSLGAALVVRAVRQGLRPGACSLWSPAVRPRLSMWPRYGSPEKRAELRTTGYVLKPENGVRLGRPILRSLRATDLGPNAFALGVRLLVCHGTDDARIPIEHTREVFHASGEDSALLVEFPGASHSFGPAPDQRRLLFELFLHWLSDGGLRSRRGCLGSPQDWQGLLPAAQGFQTDPCLGL